MPPLGDTRGSAGEATAQHETEKVTAHLRVRGPERTRGGPRGPERTRDHPIPPPRLDPAMVRPGRVDVIHEVGYICI